MAYFGSVLGYHIQIKAWLSKVACQSFLKGSVAAVIAQLKPLLKVQPAILVANSQKHFIPIVGMNLLAGRHH